jgi:hypothetical protein
MMIKDYFETGKYIYLKSSTDYYHFCFQCLQASFELDDASKTQKQRLTNYKFSYVHGQITITN